MGPSYQGGCRDDIWVGFVGSGKRIVRTIAFVVTSHRQYKTPASAGVFYWWESHPLRQWPSARPRIPRNVRALPRCFLSSPPVRQHLRLFQYQLDSLWRLIGRILVALQGAPHQDAQPGAHAFTHLPVHGGRLAQLVGDFDGDLFQDGVACNPPKKHRLSRTEWKIRKRFPWPGFRPLGWR